MKKDLGILKDIQLKDAHHLDVVFCRRNTLLSRLIRKFTRSEWSHTALVVNYNGVIFIADSQRNGTNIKELSVWQEKYKYETRIARLKSDILINKRVHIENKIYGVLGVTGYDFSSLLLKQPIYLLTGKWLGKRKDPAKKRLYCSEFIAYIFDIGRWWKKTPEDIWNIVHTNNNWIV